MTIMTVSEMKTLLGIADATDDAELLLRMTALEGRFESFLDRKLARAVDSEEIFDGLLVGTHLLLARFPVESVASVHVSPTQTWDAASLYDSSLYLLNPARGRIGLVSGYAWPIGEQNIRVVFTGGFVAAGTIPAPSQYAVDEAIRRAFAMQAEFEWRNKAHIGQSNASATGASVGFGQADLLPEVQAALGKFIRY